jgi:hypothetical protein
MELKNERIEKMSADGLEVEAWVFDVFYGTIRMINYSHAKRSSKRNRWLQTKYYRSFDNRGGIPREEVPPVDIQEVREAFKRQIDKMEYSKEGR